MGGWGGCGATARGRRELAAAKETLAELTDEVLLSLIVGCHGCHQSEFWPSPHPTWMIAASDGTRSSITTPVMTKSM